jgi:hypothetical protein
VIVIKRPKAVNGGIQRCIRTPKKLLQKLLSDAGDQHSCLAVGINLFYALQFEMVVK